MITRYKHNVELPDDRFDLPAPVKALLNRAQEQSAEENAREEGAASSQAEK